MESARAVRSLVIVAVALLVLPVIGAFLASVVAQEPPEFEWGDELVLSDSSEASDDATVALMPGGGMVVAWRERQLARYNVFFVVLDAEGQVVGQRQELGSNLSASMDPVVAVDSDGRMHFVWTAMEDQELWYARADRYGRVQKGPIRLTDADGDSAEASVWMDNRDHLHVVWFDGRDQVTYLYYMQLDRSGNKVVEDTQLVRTRTEQESAVAADSRGDLHVVWNAVAPVGQLQWNTEVHYTKVSSTGEVLVADRVIATSRGNIGYPDLAVDLSNNVHVVFPDGVGPRETIRYAMLDSSGRLETEREVVGGVEDRGAGDVALAVDGNNRLHMVWSQGLVSNTEVFYQAMDDEGIAMGDPVQLTDASLDSRFPAIGLSLKGEPRVAWSDRRSGNYEIYMRVASLPVTGVDLAVYASEMSFDPPTVTGGQQFVLGLKVHNQGDATVDIVEVEVRVDGVRQVTGIAYDVAPGSTTDVSLTLTLEEGEHVVTVSVTPAKETDVAPHNNVAHRSVTAYPPGQIVADAGPDVTTTAGAVTYLDASGTVYRGTGVLSHEWDFGDGSATGTGEYVEHVYGTSGLYTVTLRVSDGLVEDTDTCQVEVGERDDPPRAVIVPGGPVVGDRLTPVTLSATGSSDDNGIVNLTWEMGDGTVLEGWSVSHLYDGVGIYPVTLIVIDTGGLVDINRTTVSIENLAPEIVSVEAKRKAKVGDELRFNVTAVDPDGRVAQVGWDFDVSDGIDFERTGPTVKHEFGRAGKYNVTCIVRDNEGGQAVYHLEVTVEDDGSSPLPGGFPLAALMAMAAVAAIYIIIDKKPYQSEY